LRKTRSNDTGLIGRLRRAPLGAGFLAAIVGLVCLAVSASASSPVAFTAFGAVTAGPGGSVVVSATTKRGASSLYVLDAAKRLRRLSHGVATCGHWSPSSGRVAFFDGQDLVTVLPNGLRRVVLRHFPGNAIQRENPAPSCNTGPIWSPDGARLAYSTDANAVSVIDVATKQTKVLYRSNNLHFAWSPDSAHLAVTDCDRTVSGDCTPGRIYLLTLRGTKSRVPGLIAHDACSISWAPAPLIITASVGPGLVVTGPGGSHRHSIGGSACANVSPDGTRLAGISLVAAGSSESVMEAPITAPTLSSVKRFPRRAWAPGASVPTWSVGGASLVGWWMYGKLGGPTVEKLYRLDLKSRRLTVLLQTAPAG